MKKDIDYLNLAIEIDNFLIKRKEELPNIKVVIENIIKEATTNISLMLDVNTALKRTYKNYISLKKSDIFSQLSKLPTKLEKKEDLEFLRSFFVELNNITRTKNRRHYSS